MWNQRPFLLTLPLLAALAGTARAETPYKAEITGAPDSEVESDLSEISQLVTLEDHPPQSEAALRLRAQADRPRIEQALNAHGYWSARIDIRVDAAASPEAVTIAIEAGPLYHLRRIAFLLPDGGTDPFLEAAGPAAFGLKPGEPARSADILAAEPRITAAYGRHGHPFAKVTSRRVVVDQGTLGVDVAYTAEPGREARFGPVSIEGLGGLDRGYIERRIGWREGAAYDSGTVEGTRKALSDSGLFSEVQVSPVEAAVTDTDAVPMTVKVKERVTHSVGAGVSYNTSLGIGTQGFWEDRNLFGNAQKLRVTADLAQSRLGAIAQFRDPDFIQKDQDLLGTAELAEDTPPAYTSRRQALFVGLERRFNPLLAGGGLQIEHAVATETARSLTATHTLLGLPLYLRQDSTDDLLNPSRGMRGSLALTPWHGIAGPGVNFGTARFSGSLYSGLGDRVIAAGLFSLGSAVGATRDAIPVDKRLYAGGGGSLRGYGYQLAGPLGPGNKPLGGRSSVELSAELRIRVTDTIGIVPFVDAGNVYEKPLPDARGKLLYDAGIGARYYTSFGPVRFDIATPLSKRPGDADFQIYVSLGQAF